MRHIKSSDFTYIPATHEDPKNPGVLKKVLLKREEIVDGRVQMINWCRLPSGKSFRAHYHEDMDEIFLLVSGTAQMRVNETALTLEKGDGVVVEMREVHEMKNTTSEDVEYIVIGVTRSLDGKTVVV